MKDQSDRLASKLPVYLDCNATTPTEPRVVREVMRFMADEFGNAGSRTHRYGALAKQAVERAREQVAHVVGAERDEVVFTSGATESNNLALLGLAPHGERTGKRHIVSTQIEHKAVLEPLSALRERGFEVTLVPPARNGRVDADAVYGAVRSDTLLVSLMHVNNETGVIQPVAEAADLLADSEAFLHVDAAQGFGKELTQLTHRRIDLISISAHKIYGPKGVGALIARRRGHQRPPLTPLMVGGGQERGVRPGTLPVPLVAGFGLASEIAVRDHQERRSRWLAFREQILAALQPLRPTLYGDPAHTLPTTLCLSFPGIDSEALMVALKDSVAISNGSACTSHSYQPSHVLEAMGLSEQERQGAVRFSWCHLTGTPDWNSVTQSILRLQ